MLDSGKILGILGGLGPMSSVYFYEMLTSHTEALTDQEHLNILISSRADTPDRTDFILGKSSDNPLPVMKSEIAKLVGAGADVIAIPCNTAHYFYEGISADSPVPIINIVRQTAIFCKRMGIRRVGILATEGTVASGSYSEIFGMAGIDCVVPDKDEQKIISNIIYGQIKKGIAPDMEGFRQVSESLMARGCERLVLGCTELSLLKRNGALDSRIYVDSLEVLAYSSIRACGKTPVGFDAELMSFRI
ncbi:MAG: amino acid racemase [Ruminococcaceae bacterium]|nr:amino acid racemase [Oscillospiraceae bacterium]